MFNSIIVSLAVLFSAADSSDGILPDLDFGIILTKNSGIHPSPKEGGDCYEQEVISMDTFEFSPLCVC